MDDVNRLDGKSASTEGATAEADGRHRRISGRRTCGIAIMAKASAPGRTKTRLVPPLTFDEAAALNTAFLRTSPTICCSPRVTRRSPATPPTRRRGSEGFFHRVLPPAIGLIDACLPNFGDCLFRTIEEILRPRP